MLLLIYVLIMQWMEDGPAGVPGLAAISVVVVDVLFGLVPAPAPHPRMVGRNAKERRTMSNPATPSPVVRLTQHVHPKLEHPDPPPVCKEDVTACDQHLWWMHGYFPIFQMIKDAHQARNSCHVPSSVRRSARTSSRASSARRVENVNLAVAVLKVMKLFCIHWWDCLCPCMNNACIIINLFFLQYSKASK